MVDLDVVEGRFPEAVELAVYFVVDAALRFVDAGAIRVSAREPLPAKLHKIFLRLEEVIANLKD